MSEDALRASTSFLADPRLQGRRAGSAGAAEARTFIAAKFAEAGLAPAGTAGYDQPFKSPYGDTRNVLGLLAGSDAALAPQVIVIGAHYDHLGVLDGQMYPGAHDNAAGAAAVVEIARVAAGLHGKLRRTIVFAAFDAEEQGLLGARYYTGNPIAPPLSNTIYMINLDQIGYLDVAGSLNAAWANSAPAAAALLTEIAAAYPQAAPVSTRYDWTNSDHYPFIDNSIPAVYLATAFWMTPYHTPQDTAERIDYAGAAVVTRIALELMWRIDQEDLPPAFTVVPRVAAASIDRGKRVRRMVQARQRCGCRSGRARASARHTFWCTRNAICSSLSSKTPCWDNPEGTNLCWRWKRSSR